MKFDKINGSCQLLLSMYSSSLNFEEIEVDSYSKAFLDGRSPFVTQFSTSGPVLFNGESMTRDLVYTEEDGEECYGY
jgi:hypothetical protein